MLFADFRIFYQNKYVIIFGENSVYFSCPKTLKLNLDHRLIEIYLRPETFSQIMNYILTFQAAKYNPARFGLPEKRFKDHFLSISVSNRNRNAERSENLQIIIYKYHTPLTQTHRPPSFSHLPRIITSKANEINMKQTDPRAGPSGPCIGVTRVQGKYF